jgi:ribonuclease G
MSLKMLIESDPHQTRIAVLEDDRLTEIFVERHRHRGLVGNIYKGRVTRVLPGMQAAFVDVGLERDAFLYVSDVASDVESMEDLELDDGRSDDIGNNHNHHPQVSPSIDDLLKAGQEIIVQVVKDPLPNKGARISTHVTLPGRYLVLLPTVRHFGVSRRIEDEAERERLITLLQQLPMAGGGLIVRTAGEEKGREEFESDLLYLSRLWDKVRQRFGIEEQIEAALKSKVWLKSGGYIVINPTEALVAIDVNTGRFVGQTNLEDTVLQTNLEAVQEIVRQIRLRDLGGIIVIDLIDMVEAAHREQVFASLESEIKKDRAKTKLLNISEFGLVEVTRKRSRANLERLLTQACPYCSGRGRIKSIATICLNLRKELLHLRGRIANAELLLRVHPEIARALQQEERAILDELERSLGVHVLIQSDPELHHERFDVVEV